MSSAASNPKFRAVDPSTGLALVGGKLFTYAAGTTTPQATYANAALSVANTNPIILDANGEASIYVGPLAYKFVLQDSTGAAIWTFDNYAPDVAAQTASEWNQYASAIAFSSATTFVTTNVDTTPIFTVGRRVKATVTAGTVYGTVTSSLFIVGTGTMVQLVMDGASALDAGLSAVYSGLLSYNPRSYLDPPSRVFVLAQALQTLAAAMGKVTVFSAAAVDTLGEMAASRFTAKYPGYYLVEVSATLLDAAAVTYQLAIYKNGGDYAHINQFANSGYANLAVQAVVQLNSNEYVEIFAAGTATSVLRSGVPGSYLNVVRLS